jgi:hypothetical protein
MVIVRCRPIGVCKVNVLFAAVYVVWNDWPLIFVVLFRDEMLNGSLALVRLAVALVAALV